MIGLLCTEGVISRRARRSLCGRRRGRRFNGL